MIKPLLNMFRSNPIQEVKQLITRPTYDQIHDACIMMGEQIKHDRIKFDMILGLVRGGTLPAVILSHYLDVPCLAVHYSSKSGNGDDKYYGNQLPNFNTPQNLLVVDDICDSGHTIGEVYSHYTLKKHLVRTVVLYHKENTRHEPDYQWIKIPKDSPWIIFPFEQEDGNSGR